MGFASDSSAHTDTNIPVPDIFAKFGRDWSVNAAGDAERTNGQKIQIIVWCFGLDWRPTTLQKYVTDLQALLQLPWSLTVLMNPSIIGQKAAKHMNYILTIRALTSKLYVCRGLIPSLLHFYHLLLIIGHKAIRILRFRRDTMWQMWVRHLDYIALVDVLFNPFPSNCTFNFSVCDLSSKLLYLQNLFPF